MIRATIRLGLGLVTLGVGLGGLTVLPNACTAPQPVARALQVTQRDQLIGGPRALGEVGDFLLENDQVRVIIQNTGFSRGFGVFGGSLIDADLVRTDVGPGDSAGGAGHDMFGEMFPAFFLEALEPNDVVNPLDPSNPAPENRLKAIEVVHPGGDGAPAEVVVRGYGGDFLALTQQINQVLLSDDRNNPQLMFTTRYRLRPGVRYVEIETTVQNISIPPVSITLPNELAGVEVPTPFGDIILFGAGNKVFMPHEAGYDLRFRLEEQYRSNRYTLPALPGITGEFIASTGPDVSYGVLAAEPADPERNYVWQNRDQYEGATPHSLHVPFIASAFTGVFQVTPPPELTPNDRAEGGTDEYTFKRYFIIGSGDVASISDVVYDVLGDATGGLRGRVLDQTTGEPVTGAHLIVFAEDGVTKVTEVTTREHGRYAAKLRPGAYQVRLVEDGFQVSEPTSLTIEEQSDTFLDLRRASPARVSVTVVEDDLGPVPAKVTLVGTAPEEFVGQDSKTWLFDLSVGEHWRYTDLVPDTEDASTRQYIEAFDYTDDGHVTLTARPGRYRVVASRGAEYDRWEGEVELVPGQTQSLTARLHRVVDTTGYVGADFHLHSSFSLDSFHRPRDRVLSFAGEGLELVVSTDHNFVSDYQPAIGDLGLERFLASVVGLELTTIDRGHFNGFPLRVGEGALSLDGKGIPTNTIESKTFGSFAWAGAKPQEIMDRLRAAGRVAPSPTCVAEQGGDPTACADELQPVVVQVNHPRDSILGYFDQYGVNQDSLVAEGQSGLIAPVLDVHPEFSAEYFSWDFDAIEVFNGKRFEMLRNFQVPAAGVPEVLGFGTVDPLSCCPVVPGEVMRIRSTFDCDPEVRDCACTAADVQAQLDANRCQAGDIQAPGAVDDWFQLLRTGKRVVGTANSDSHEPEKEEPGYPRTYIRVPVDEPRLLQPSHISAAFAAGDILMTNGPFVRVEVEGADGQGVGMGGTVQGREVTLRVEIQVAPWVGVDHIAVIQSGETVAARDISMGEALTHSERFDLTFAQDGFLVVEVSGQQSLFPTVFPNEIPPIQFTDVVGAIGGSFGLGGDAGLTPELIFPTTAYALTNPVWVDADGDGEVSPSLTLPEVAAQVAVRHQPAAGDLPAVAPPQAVDGAAASTSPVEQHYAAMSDRKKAELARSLPLWLWPTDHPKDVRRVLVQFLKHAH